MSQAYVVPAPGGNRSQDLLQSPVFLVLALLLSYPEEDLIHDLPEMRNLLTQAQQQQLAPLFERLIAADDLIELQEQYVATFDRKPSHALHLFEHVHGESRNRGQAMVDLQDEYLRHGLVPDSSELPDYIPLFLEFLSQIPAPAAHALLDEAVHILARLSAKLTQAGSTYAVVFKLLTSMSSVIPETLPEPAEGDPEETMVTFGPSGGDATPIAQPLIFHKTPPRPSTTSHTIEEK